MIKPSEKPTIVVGRKPLGKHRVRYEKKHADLFCPAEQTRLRESLQHAVKMIRTDSPVKRALDCGCGTGNLTRHLVDLGLHVMATDVSKKSLRCVREEFARTGMVKTMLAGGEDLSEIEDDHFDMTACYSVLHHVGDYLKMVAELARVTAPGGVVYIDHEASEIHWQDNAEYARLCRIVEANCPQPPRWKKYFQPVRYVWKVRQMLNRRFQPEGDIHVWLDDHIEWDRIESVFIERGLEVLAREDYLFESPYYPPEMFAEYKDKCRDTGLIIARKRLAPAASSPSGRDDPDN